MAPAAGLPYAEGQMRRVPPMARITTPRAVPDQGPDVGRPAGPGSGWRTISARGHSCRSVPQIPGTPNNNGSHNAVDRSWVPCPGRELSVRSRTPRMTPADRVLDCGAGLGEGETVGIGAGSGSGCRRTWEGLDYRRSGGWDGRLGDHVPPGAGGARPGGADVCLRSWRSWATRCQAARDAGMRPRVAKRVARSIRNREARVI